MDEIEYAIPDFVFELLFWGTALCCLWLCTRWVWRRLFSWGVEARARALLRDFESHDASLEQELTLLRGPDGPEAVAGAQRAPVVGWGRRRRKGMAFALAEEAYYQFGHRDRSEANLLVTRKFMRDMLKEHRDLRARDASDLIDRALYLSFLPSYTLREMNVLSDTHEFAVRNSNSSSWFHKWWRGFHATPRG